MACDGAYVGGLGGWVDIGTVCSLSEIDTTGAGVSYSGILALDRGGGGTFWIGREVVRREDTTRRRRIEGKVFIFTQVIFYYLIQTMSHAVRHSNPFWR